MEVHTLIQPCKYLLRQVLCIGEVFNNKTYRGEFIEVFIDLIVFDGVIPGKRNENRENTLL